MASLVHNELIYPHLSGLLHWHRRNSSTLQWRHNRRDSVSNRQAHCLFNRLFRRRSKKTSKLRVTGLCEENSPGTGEFPAQRASNAENASIWIPDLWLLPFGKIIISTDDRIYYSTDNTSYSNHYVVFGRANANADQIAEFIVKSTEFQWKSVVFCV